MEVYFDKGWNDNQLALSHWTIRTARNITLAAETRSMAAQNCPILSVLRGGNERRRASGEREEGSQKQKHLRS